jgi:hypothetical protein
VRLGDSGHLQVGAADLEQSLVAFGRPATCRIRQAELAGGSSSPPGSIRDTSASARSMSSISVK